jgi:hypothetical protein
MNLLLLHPAAFPVITFIALLLLLEIGWRLGRREHRRSGNTHVKGIGALEGAVFALLGLLLAFTFSSAADRFDVRRALAVEEANRVDTAYLRLSVLRPEDRPALQKLFRDYGESRLLFYADFKDEREREAAFRHSQELQQRIWSAAVAAAQAAGGGAQQGQVLEPINRMFDAATTRVAASRTHPADEVYVMVAALVIASTLIAGFAMTAGDVRPMLHAVIYSAAITATLHTIVYMEHPRLAGIASMSEFDRYLKEVVTDMKSGP